MLIPSSADEHGSKELAKLLWRFAIILEMRLQLQALVHFQSGTTMQRCMQLDLPDDSVSICVADMMSPPASEYHGVQTTEACLCVGLLMFC